jgi:hypothetical protein
LKINQFNILFFSFLVFSYFISPVFAESESVNISNSDSKSFHPQILADKENLYFVWTDESSGNRDIFFSKSNDDGLSFSSPVNLSNNSGNSIFPRIAISENNIYVTWYDYTPCKSDIFFAKSLNGGDSFETVNLSSSPGVSYNPWVAALGKKVYVVWNDSTLSDGTLPPGESVCQEGYDSTQHQDIFIASSEDNGLSFEQTRITSTLFAWNPRIAVMDDAIFLIWNQQKSAGATDIFFTHSNDGGKSFDKPKSVSNSDNRSEDGAIKVTENNIYIIWKEIMPKSSDIYFSQSLIKENSFSIPINLSNDTSKSVISRDAQLKFQGDNIYVVWYEQPPDSSGVFFVKSSDKGEGFSKKIKLDENSTGSEFAQIEIHDQSLYVIWEDDKFGESQVLLRQSHDGGNSFGSIKSISDNQAEAHISILGPQLASTEDEIFVFWEKVDSDKSDLFLDSIAHTLDYDKMILETSNNLLNIELDFNQSVLDIKEPATFTLRFIDSSSGNLIENVNYSFFIEDLNGRIIYDDSQYTEDGSDSQTVQFSQTGPVTVKITVDGQGIEKPYDAKYEGETNAVFTVIPEFPLSAIGILSIVMASGILLRKFKIL